MYYKLILLIGTISVSVLHANVFRPRDDLLTVLRDLYSVDCYRYIAHHLQIHIQPDVKRFTALKSPDILSGAGILTRPVCWSKLYARKPMSIRNYAVFVQHGHDFGSSAGANDDTRLIYFTQDQEFLRHVGSNLLCCVDSDDTVIPKHASSSTSSVRKAQSHVK